MATPPYLSMVVGILILFITPSQQNSRSKRAVSSEQARILTDNGHLIFQTGTNHNITFRSTGGGFVNLDGENFKNIVDTVKNNKKEIDRLKQNQNSNDVTSRLDNIESRLDSLTPTGEVANKLNLLTNQFNDLRNRVTTLESNLNNEDEDQIRRVKRKVNRLEDELNTLKAQLEVDDCASSPCRNGGTCVDMFNTFMCRCPNNWEGPKCEVDVNECIVYAGTGLGCQNLATCINTPGSYQCQCTANYRGVRCTETHDDCTGASTEALCGHGTCVNQARHNPNDPKYTCICNDGWTTNGRDPECNVDVNECTAPRSPCSVDPAVPCINIPGSFHCGACPAGFSGNGYTCTDINECETNNGGCSQSPRVSCTNTPGSRQCGVCPPGYQGNGVTCNYIGVCNRNNGGCHSHAICTEVPNIEGRICRCAPGYMGDGVGMAGCVPTQGGCTPNPCVHGNCSVSGFSYTCTCELGWAGANCNEDINECLSQPCLNNGTCTNQPNGYSCTCTDEFMGTNCQDAVASCGGRLNADSGSLHYPEETGAMYPHGMSCAWVITVSNDKIIRVNFSEFHLEYHAACNYDWLQLHDGPTAASHLIGKYCGTYAPGNGSVVTTHNKLYMWFHTDASQGGDGFALSWEALTPECGGNLESNYGQITSPGYPGNYPHNRNCVWTISVFPGNNIQLSFGEIKLEHHANCEYDYLKVYDGLEDTDTEIGTFCSTMSPPPLTTSMPYVRLLFHTDSSTADKGFDIRYSAIPAVAGCGGTLTEDRGVLISPNYPNSYPHNVECVWLISVQSSLNIQLTFTHFDVEHHSECTMDYVEVRNGRDETAPLIGRYCGRDSIPARALSTGGNLWIKFKTDASNRGTGFRAEYVVPCGGTFTAPSGELQSPLYPSNYPNEKECSYLITAPQGSVITITFDVFGIEGDDAVCNYDYLKIYNGGNDAASLLGTYCGVTLPGPFVSTNNQMFMKFASDGSVANHGFHATYTFSEGGPGPSDNCGGTLTDTEGTFRSPGYPGSYPTGANCRWYIRTTEGSAIRLTFDSFNMESHDDCQYDNVIIRDGSSEGSPSLGRFCGSRQPPILTSSGNALTIIFSSDDSVSQEGFLASWVTLNTTGTCGGLVTEEEGIITSPNFPENYPDSAFCEWTINLRSGRQILLNITDFDLESVGEECNHDSLRINNGGFANSPLIGTFCGTTIPNIIRSHSNSIYLKFTSDGAVRRRGFRITYDGTTSGCGGELTASRGEIVSPNYPLPYGHNAECYWKISVARGSQILLTFEQFGVEAHENCNYDYVEVREENAQGEKLGHFCGTNLPAPITSKGSNLFIKFRTDYSNNAPGFYATYRAMCNLTITAHLGVIESPNFPDSYPSNSNCNWIIIATHGNTINVSFSHLSIERHGDCNYDYLKLVDGPQANSSEIGRYCGNILPMPVSSSTNRLSVIFRSDAATNYGGFRMEYMVHGCGGHFMTPTGQFHSPNYPSHYESNRECIWTIDSRPGSSINLTIHDIDVEEHPNCDYDVLEVRGGPDENSPLLTQLCHTRTQPLVLTSTGNHMYVRFKTDQSTAGRGFQASYTTIDGGCGGTLSIPSGSIASKNYPNAYPSNTDCTWNIVVEPGRSVELEWIAFDVEGHETCNYDNVAVYDGANAGAPLIQKACGSGLPSPVKIRSSDNKMFIRMISDGSVNAAGFLANFTTGCGGRLTVGSEDGAIVSPGWPGQYEHNSNCTWVMQSEINAQITLAFTHMDLESLRNCSHDNVTVYDGDSVSAPLIGQYCGRATPSSITSDGSALTVHFQSDSSEAGTGFRATYSASTSFCGGDFTSEQGSFNSPGYPYNYQNGLECVWTISTSPGNRVQVSFSSFDLEESEFCNLDFVEVRKDGPGGEFIGRYCGEDLPRNLTTASRLWIKFRTNEDITRNGFTAEYNSEYGGDITSESSGQIASPLYPSSYPHGARYVWTITVDTDQYIRVTFKIIDIEQSNGCQYDNIKFLDGPDPDSLEIGAFCGTELPAPIHSSGNTLRVEFSSDASSNGRGFLIDWQATHQAPVTPTPPGPSVTPNPGCGGDLIAGETTQSFISPGYPQSYANNLLCDWLIQSETGSKVWLNITDIELESHSSCNFDYVGLYADGSLTSTVRKVCRRSSVGYTIMSTGNKLLVRFNTDSSVNKTGFSADYRAVCGGLTEGVTQGAIMSPGYPSNYGASSNCSWTVRVANGRTIAVTFEGFNLPGTNGQCGQDKVLLLNGGLSDSPLLGNSPFCGSTVPSSLETMSNYLTVVFTSSDSPPSGHSGFKLAYEERSVTCGGHLTLSYDSQDGYISSPNYPENYAANVDCIWVISAPPSTEIQLDFEHGFEIEAHSECNFDYVEVRDGSTENSRLLGRYCGPVAPGTLKSTDSIVYVRFRTDNSVPKKGFKAKYSIASCGGSLRADEGSVSSPNYPSTYPSGADCEWYIYASDGHFITFSFETFSMRPSPNCTGDRLEIRDYNSTGDLLATLCGSEMPQPVLTSDSFGYVRFYSDNQDNAPGFRMKFEASVEGHYNSSIYVGECGGALTTSTGTFTSPNYPNQYPHNRRCEWMITVDPDRRVRLNFNDFELEDASNCHYDYIKVYNGLLDDSPLIDTYCGDSPPEPVESTGNTMRVVFYTDGSQTFKGFAATYSSQNEATCGGRFQSGTSSVGSITSPGYNDVNGTYGNSQQCIWLIENQAHSNSSIVLNFGEEFDVESHGECFFDFLELREGFDEQGHFYDRLCGNSTSPIIMSPGPALWVRFVSDVSVVNKGFTATYSFSTCGGIITTEGSGVITSPNYPQNYDHDDNCAWKIRAPEGHQIRIQFTDFKLEEHDECLFDYLVIYNGGLASSPEMARMCNTQDPLPQYLSQSNELRIVFHSDGSSSAKGFRLEYSVDSQACGGQIHSNEGIIHTPNHPAHYPENGECIWEINVQNGYHVELTFDPHFDMEIQNPPCTNDFVEVTDYHHNGSETFLGRFCGNHAPPVLKSTTNMMRVKFRSNNRISGNGFNASFAAVCGAHYWMERGTLVSPGYPNNYANDLNCNYTITVDPQKFIILTFQPSHFGIEGLRNKPGPSDKSLPTNVPPRWKDLLEIHRNITRERPGIVVERPPLHRAVTEEVWNYYYPQYSFPGINGYLCSYDYISINQDSRNRICGYTAPQPISSLGQMELTFVSDYMITDKGWIATYETSECGGVFRDYSGIIQTPVLNEYHDNANCTWNITVSADRVVELKFLDFSIEAHSECRYDYVDIYDGDDFSSPSIGKFCGQEIPGAIKSTGRSMLLNFISDNSVSTGGFRAAYRTAFGVNQGCGGVLNGTSGRITSVNTTQGQYESNLDCVWQIIAPGNKNVRLHYESFSVEEGEECEYDFLEVRDGMFNTDPLVGKFCGISTPSDFTSASNVLFLRFYSDDSVQARGFTITYTTQDADCGGSYMAEETSKSISSPNYPNAYPANSRCRWTIGAPEGSTVQVDFENINLPDTEGCPSYFVEVKDYPVGDEGSTFHYCGTNAPHVFQSIGRTVQVNLITRGSVSGTGFRLNYKIASCNRTYEAANGRIVSPGWPGNYPRNTICDILVTAPPGNSLSLYFNNFRIESHDECNYDYLQIHNGSDASTAVLYTLCGGALPSPVSVPGNSLFMKFVTDSSVTHTGYDITYTSSPNGCGGNLTATHGSFASPSYPDEPSPRGVCSWLITVPARRQITLEFPVFDIEHRANTTNCDTNYVAVYDGMTLSDALVGRYCGPVLPATFTSTSNKLFVQFKSDTLFMGSGFLAKYTS